MPARALASRDTHEIRFKGHKHHGLRAFCTCGWHAETPSGQTLADLAHLVEQHHGTRT